MGFTQDASLFSGHFWKNEGGGGEWIKSCLKIFHFAEKKGGEYLEGGGLFGVKLTDWCSKKIFVSDRKKKVILIKQIKNAKLAEMVAKKC